jgi:3-dehydrosphinganine reductase
MFKERVVIITGGSSGLGKELAERFLAEGGHVALVARDPKKLEAVRNELKSKAAPGRKIEAYSCDVSDMDSVQKTFNLIAETLGIPDILVNSAGILKEGYFEQLPLDTFRNVMDINFFGIIHCIRAVLPHFKTKGKGRIVNIASLGGRIGSFGYTAYCSAKFALVGLTETLRCELKPRNITLHLVCPGEFDSPMVDELNTYRTHENKVLTQTVPVLPLDRVAGEVMEGLRKNRYLIIPGKAARLVDASNRWLPFLTRFVTDLKLKRIYRGPEGKAP